jgi:hypothetical protein
MKSGVMKPKIGKGYVFTFGQYKGSSIEDVMFSDPGYILWLHDNGVAIISKFLLEQAEDATYREFTEEEDIFLNWLGDPNEM